MKRIFLQQDGLSGSGPVPAGYKEIGYNGVTFSERSGVTSSTIDGGSDSVKYWTAGSGTYSIIANNPSGLSQALGLGTIVLGDNIIGTANNTVYTPDLVIAFGIPDNL